MDHSSNKIKVSIVIVSWNSWQHIEGCLESLRQSDYSNYNIIVVDNASSDDSADKIAKQFPEVILIRSDTNLGWAGGSNVGMKQAVKEGADYIWLLNNDTIVPPESLSVLVASAQATPEAGLIGPVLYNEHARTQVQHCGCSRDWKNFQIQFHENLEDIKSIDSKEYWLWATALMIKREVIEKIGYLSEEYFIYYDDMDFSLRAIGKGYDHKLESKASVYHRQHFSGGTRTLPLHYYYYITRNDYFIWMRNLPWYKRFGFVRQYLERNLCSVATHVKSNDNDIVDAYLDAIYAAFRNKTGVWDKNYHMPKFIKMFVMKHPYFACDLAGLHFWKIIKSGFKRVETSVIKLKPNK